MIKVIVLWISILLKVLLEYLNLVVSEACAVRSFARPTLGIIASTVIAVVAIVTATAAAEDNVVATVVDMAVDAAVVVAMVAVVVVVEVVATNAIADVIADAVGDAVADAVGDAVAVVIAAYAVGAAEEIRFILEVKRNMTRPNWSCSNVVWYWLREMVDHR